MMDRFVYKGRQVFFNGTDALNEQEWFSRIFQRSTGKIYILKPSLSEEKIFQGGLFYSITTPVPETSNTATLSTQATSTDSEISGSTADLSGGQTGDLWDYDFYSEATVGSQSTNLELLV